MDAKLFSENIKAIRHIINVSQNDMAKLLSVSPATISKWERGLLGKISDQRAVNIFLKVERVSNFPKKINFQMFLKSNLSAYEIESDQQADSDEKNYTKLKPLTDSFETFLDKTKIRLVLRPNEKETEVLRSVYNITEVRVKNIDQVMEYLIILLRRIKEGIFPVCPRCGSSIENIYLEDVQNCAYCGESISYGYDDKFHINEDDDGAYEEYMEK